MNFINDDEESVLIIKYILLSNLIKLNKIQKLFMEKMRTVLY